MNILLLNEFSVNSLKEFGWYEGRKVDVSKCVEQLESEGFECFPYAKEILEELDGLYIRPRRNKNDKIVPGEIDFNALGAGSGEHDRLEIFEQIAGEGLFPLGMIYQWFLYVGVSEKIYMGCYSEFYLVGHNIEECLNNVLEGKNKPIMLHK